MNLASAAAELRQERPCKLGRIIAGLDDDDLATVGEWVEHLRSASWISQVLTKAGAPVARDTILYHLRGFCSCPEAMPYRGAIEWDG